jgi:hypothetical protein
MKTDDKKCFSAFDIGAYIEGSLSSDQRESFERHLAGCHKCWSEFVAVNRVIMNKDDVVNEDAPAYMVEKTGMMFPEKSSMLDIALKLVKDSVDVVYRSLDINIFSPLPATGLRSGKTMRPEMIVLKKSFKDIDVQLDIEKVSENICNIRVSVDTLKGRDLIKGLRVELISKGRELISDLLEDGETVLEDISSGRYTINICRKRKILGQIALKLQ